MSGVALCAANADFTPTRCSFSPGYAVISSVRFGSWRFLYSSAMNFWTSTWKPTYCQNEIVVGALALVFGALSSAGFLSSPVGVLLTVGWAPPVPLCADARPARSSNDDAAADARPSSSSLRRDIPREVACLGRWPASSLMPALLPCCMKLLEISPSRNRGGSRCQARAAQALLPRRVALRPPRALSPSGRPCRRGDRCPGRAPRG